MLSKHRWIQTNLLVLFSRVHNEQAIKNILTDRQMKFDNWQLAAS